MRLPLAHFTGSPLLPRKTEAYDLCGEGGGAAPVICSMISSVVEVATEPYDAGETADEAEVSGADA